MDSQAPDLTKYVADKKNDAELVAWISNQYQAMRSARHRVTMQWNLNLAFYYGRQYLEFSPVIAGKLQVPKAPPHRIRLTVNRVRPMIRTEISRLTQQKPSASVVPSTSEDEDLEAAYAAEQVWEYVSRANYAPRAFREAAFWACITGVGFVKTYWNSTKGPMGPDPRNPLGPQIPMGDIEYQSVTPYHLFVPNLRMTDIQAQPYVMNVFTKTVEQLKLEYGDRITGMEISPSVVASNEILSDAVLNLSGDKSEPDAVMCYEVWVKPGGHKLLPKGGLVHVVGSNIVYKTDAGIPYQHGKYPFSKIDHIPTGKFYPDSSIVDFMPLQREYNRTRSQITEAKNRMAKPQWKAAKGSITTSKMTTEPGQVIEYRPGLPAPEQVVLQPLPAYVIQEQDRIISDMEDISGQHQVSKGEAPPGVTAATAISFLQEKDDGILSHTYISVEEAWEDIAFQTLNLVVQYWDVQRTVKTTGADGSFDVMLLKGSDLKNSTDVRMEGGSSLPVSKAARQAFIMDMMKMGFIPPQDGLKILDVGGVQKLWEKLRRDESQAQRENIKLKKSDPTLLEEFQQQQQQMIQQQAAMGQPQIDPMSGQPVPPQPMAPESVLAVNSWDNHAVHIEVHNGFRKSQEFEILPDPIKAEFEAHVNMHLAAAQQSMMQAQNAMGAGMPSAPPTQTEQAGGMPPEQQGGTP